MKGQIKIQEMAFVLVAIFIFLSLVALIFVSVRSGSLKNSAQELKEDKAREAVRKLSGTPELMWADCPGCIDLDKAFALKERINTSDYESLWDFKYLALESIYPSKSGGECTKSNYPECNKTTIIHKENYGTASVAFVSLCHWEKSPGYVKCELGKIYAANK